MDWSYTDIPITPGQRVRLFREQKMLHHVEDPQQLDNEPLYPEVSSQNWEHTWSWMTMRNQSSHLQLV
jgi:hypothetical protein